MDQSHHSPQSEGAPAALKRSELAERALHRRAVEVAIWGMPIVATDAMREACRRDAGATYTDIVYFTRIADWKLQFATPNGSTYYVALFINLAQGPVVIEMPAALGAGLFGSVNDAWQAPVADFGPAGEDGGKGGKYVILPPGYDGDAPAGYFPVQFSTINGYSALRAIPEGNTPADIERALALVRQMRIYPLAQAANPPASRHIDMAGKLLNGIPAYDDTFYDRLATILDEEPVQTRDLVALGQFRTLGYERGNPFDPDAKTRAMLKEAMKEAQATFVAAITHGQTFFPGRQWQAINPQIAIETAFSFLTPDYFALDERADMFYILCGVPKKLGAATFYLNGVFDAQGRKFDGGKTYTLRVPADVPAKQFWATTIYDYDTASFLWESPKTEINSFHNLQKNADGSVDLYFAPRPPAGKEDNWAYTAPGKSWFMMFRFYGPEQQLFERTWQLPDVEEVPGHEA